MQNLTVSVVNAAKKSLQEVLITSDPGNTLAVKREVYTQYRFAYFPVIVKDGADEINLKLSAFLKTKALHSGLPLLLGEPPLADDKDKSVKCDEAIWKNMKVTGL